MKSPLLTVRPPSVAAPPTPSAGEVLSPGLCDTKIDCTLVASHCSAASASMLSGRKSTTLRRASTTRSEHAIWPSAAKGGTPSAWSPTSMTMSAASTAAAAAAEAAREALAAAVLATRRGAVAAGVTTAVVVSAAFFTALLAAFLIFLILPHTSRCRALASPSPPDVALPTLSTPANTAASSCSTSSIAGSYSASAVSSKRTGSPLSTVAVW